MEQKNWDRRDILYRFFLWTTHKSGTNRDGRHWQDFLSKKEKGNPKWHRLSYLPLKEERQGQDWSFFDIKQRKKGKQKNKNCRYTVIWKWRHEGRPDLGQLRARNRTVITLIALKCAEKYLGQVKQTSRYHQRESLMRFFYLRFSRKAPSQPLIFVSSEHELWINILAAPVHKYTIADDRTVGF